MDKSANATLKFRGDGLFSLANLCNEVAKDIMRPFKIHLITVIVTAFCSVPTPLFGTLAPEYSRTRELPPVQISVIDLDQILQKTTAFISKANGPTDDRTAIRELLRVGNGGDRIMIPGASLSGVQLPKVEFNFKYEFDQSDKSITSVEIDFDDYSRRLSVQGKAVEQVEALSDLLERSFLEHSIMMGGSTFRSAGGFAGVTIFWILLAVSLTYTVRSKETKMFGVVICCSIGPLLIMFLPFASWFPGFALYAGEVAFLSRYGPEISFIGLLISIIGILFSYYLPPRSNKPKQANAIRGENQAA